jgi:hypothetical protein
MKSWLNKLWQTYIFTPLAGGNGKIQMDEMAKVILLIMIISASIKEGRTSQQVYPDSYWTFLFMAVFGIAGLKYLIPKKDDNKVSDNNSGVS